MVYYIALALIPLFIIVGLVWFFFAGRRNRGDETGRKTVQMQNRPRTETRVEGREA